MVFKPVASTSKTILDITDAYSLSLSNEAITIACNSLGNAITGELGSSGKAKTDITIYKGNIKLNAVASTSTPTTGQFKYTIGTPVGCTASRTDNDSLYINTISADSGYVPIILDIEGEVSLIKNFSFSKSPAGSSSYSADIHPTNGLTFTFNQHGTSVGIINTSLVMTPVNISSPTYVWKKNGVNQTNNTDTLIVESSSFSAVNSIVYSCTVSGTANSGPVIITDTVTVNKTVDGLDGEDPITGYLTNESITLSADKNGTVDSYSPATGKFKVSEGLLDKTTISSFALVSSTSCTATINATTGVYSVSAMTSDYSSAEFSATYNGVTITKILNLTKSRVGLTGDSAYNITMYPTNGNVFKFSPDGDNIGIIDTTLTVSAINITYPN